MLEILKNSFSLLLWLLWLNYNYSFFNIVITSWKQRIVRSNHYLMKVRLACNLQLVSTWASSRSHQISSYQQPMKWVAVNLRDQSSEDLKFYQIAV